MLQVGVDHRILWQFFRAWSQHDRAACVSKSRKGSVKSRETLGDRRWKTTSIEDDMEASDVGKEPWRWPGDLVGHLQGEFAQPRWLSEMQTGLRPACQWQIIVGNHGQTWDQMEQMTDKKCRPGPLIRKKIGPGWASNMCQEDVLHTITTPPPVWTHDTKRFGPCTQTAPSHPSDQVFNQCPLQLKASVFGDRTSNLMWSLLLNVGHIQAFLLSTVVKCLSK